MNVLTFAATSSKNSINKKVLQFVGTMLNEHKLEVLDLNDYEMPLYSIDLEESQGIPKEAHDFLDKIKQADALIISFAEHNGNYTVAYKNIFDWMSRIDSKVYNSKRMVLLSTSPGPGGAQSVLKLAKDSAPYFGGDVVASISIPSFFENFDESSMKVTDSNIVRLIDQAILELTS